jgi:hypothetical protein
MVIIEGMPYHLPMVYLKVAGSNEVASLPFTEALGILTNVTFDYRASQAKTKESNTPTYVISGDTEETKGKTYIVTKEEMIKRLQLDIYEDKYKITDMAIQPEDELLVEEVKILIGI